MDGIQAVANSGDALGGVPALGSEVTGPVNDNGEGTGKEHRLYTSRFSDREDFARKSAWTVLCRDFFQQYISSDDTVIDIGAGDGHFIKNINAKRKIALDLSSHVRELENHGIEVLQVPATELTKHLSDKADVIFMSNFLEHLPSKRVLLEVLDECRRALQPGGMLLVLQPNIKYVGNAYWDYIDHHIALTDSSLVEGLEVSGFTIVKCIKRFLPYTAKSSTGKLASGPSAERLVSFYLRFPILWRLFGGQTFVVAAPNLQQ